MFAAIMYLAILFVVIGVAALLLLTGPKEKQPDEETGGDSQ